MNKFSKMLELAAVIFAVFVGMMATQPARGENAYLRVVGAPPVRFQAMTTNNSWLAFKSSATVTKLAANSNVKKPTGTTSANITNSVVVFHSTASLATNQTSVLPETVTDEKNSPETPVFSPNSSSSASDLLTVTPQMITEYLKPAAREAAPGAETNQSMVFVPAEMQFTPPAPKASGESQATYKIR
jgi:hypothetical protein